MHRGPLDGPVGLSGACVYTSGGTGRSSAWIIFDEGAEWCTGTGNCYDGLFGSGIGANIDLASIATHEWGHVGGLGHYGYEGNLCDFGADQLTMCPDYEPGSERWRTLERHDIDSFRARY